ncbi:MAG: hypothetical protein OEZ13_03105 [Spirochaetia bacterium]|nr:hypothetical protein [Spirochaetia bacterium]
MFKIFFLLIVGYLFYLIIRFIIGLYKLKKISERHSTYAKKNLREKDISGEAKIIEEKRLDDDQ